MNRLLLRSPSPGLRGTTVWAPLFPPDEHYPFLSNGSESGLNMVSMSSLEPVLSWEPYEKWPLVIVFFSVLCFSSLRALGNRTPPRKRGGVSVHSFFPPRYFLSDVPVISSPPLFSRTPVFPRLLESLLLVVGFPPSSLVVRAGPVLCFFFLPAILFFSLQVTPRGCRCASKSNASLL